MSTPEGPQETTPPATKRYARMGALALGIGAAIMWFGVGTTWVNVDFFDDKSGPGSTAISGSAWSTEIVAVVLLLLAGMIAGFVVRKWGRRIIGAVCAIATAGAAISPAMLLAGSADEERVRALLTATESQSNSASDTVQLTQWAEITNIAVPTVGPLVVLLGVMVALVGGILMAVRPGGDSPKLNKYETAALRREKIAEDLKSTPDSGRVMWDALDADIDPTENPTTDNPGHPR